MADAELDLYRRHTERLTPPAKPFNEAALVIGRRGGKSRVLALIAIYLATFRDYTPLPRRGRGRDDRGHRRRPAPGARDLQVHHRAPRRRADALQRWSRTRPPKRSALANRVVIEIHTASFRVTRGYSFAAVLADETAFWRNEDCNQPRR